MQVIRHPRQRHFPQRPLHRFRHLRQRRHRLHRPLQLRRRQCLALLASIDESGGVLHVYLGNGKQGKANSCSGTRVQRADMALMNERAKWMLLAQIARLGYSRQVRVC